MTMHRHSTASVGTTATLSLWINRGLELLWLLAAILTPLAFLDPSTAISEASIAYVEVPKIALLRTLAASMAILWLIEVAIRGRLPFEALLSSRSARLRPGEWLARVRRWLRDRPTRWLLLAAGFYLGTTLLSTLLSGSRNVSLWGEVPGQDGYPAYTVVAYVLLFALIATHLKTRAQMWRLLGAITAMGTLVAGYAIFQHYGHDFLNLIEQTGGGKGEVSIFMGNSLFAGATLMMVVPMTLVTAVLSVGDRRWKPAWSWPSLKPLALSLAVTGLWSSVLAVQLLGITFTFARGPWVGMVVALVGFLGMTTVFALLQLLRRLYPRASGPAGFLLGLATVFPGWQVLVRVVPVLGLTVALGVAQLHGFGSISILGLGSWLGVIIALAGFIAVAAVFAVLAVFADWHHLSWRVRGVGSAVLAVGLAVTLAAAIALALTWFRGDDGPTELESSPAAGDASAAAKLAGQISSIKGEVLSGFVSGRATHWKVSWELFRDHPWFEFDSLSLPWLRPLIGYGPDLFRYTYLLKSPAEGGDLLPNEPDNAHNFFIHHAVVQGVLGLLSTLGIFASVLIVGGYLLFRERQSYSLAQKLILVGLVATVGGRFLEMMVGVARVSDLTVLWILLALFAALPQVMLAPETALGEEPPRPDPEQRGCRRANPRPTARTYRWTFVLRMAIVVWLVGGIVILTWGKTVNNVRAAVAAGDAAESIRRGEFSAGLAGLDRAIELAPDISVYYDYKALVYLEYQIKATITTKEWCLTQENINYYKCLELRPYLIPEPECTAQQEMGYRECLAFKRYLVTQEGVEERPFYYRSRLGLADAAFDLRGTEYSITSGDQVTTVKLRDETIRLYRESLALVPNSWRIRNMLATAYIEAGRPEEALVYLEETLAITGNSLAKIGVDVRSSRAWLLQGLAHRNLGELDKAVESLRRYREVDPSAASVSQVDGILAEVYSGLGQPDLAAAAFLHQGIAYQELGEPEQSAQSFERSLELSPAGALARQAHQALAEVYSSMGRAEQAEEHRKLGQP